MEKFIKPEFEKVEFDTSDVISTSGCHLNQCSVVCAQDCGTVEGCYAKEKDL